MNKETWLLLSARHAGRLADHRTPVGSVRFLSAQMPAGPARSWRIRPLDYLVSSFLPEPRCQQALPGDRGFDHFDSARGPTPRVILPPDWVRSCLDTRFP